MKSLGCSLSVPPMPGSAAVRYSATGHRLAAHAKASPYLARPRRCYVIGAPTQVEKVNRLPQIEKAAHIFGDRIVGGQRRSEGGITQLDKAALRGDQLRHLLGIVLDVAGK